MHRSTRSVVLFTIATLTAGAAWGQNETGLQFNLSTPGARSLAMGGAFIGLADDATAAYTNPAGLTNLTVGGSEVAVELRQWEYSTLFVENGHLGGSPSGIGVDFAAGVESAESISSTSGLSFVSVAYVLPRGATVAFYHHRLANYHNDLQTQGLFHQPSPSLIGRSAPRASKLDMDIANTGISYAYEMGGLFAGRDDTLSIGVGLSYYQLDLELFAADFFVAPYAGNDAIDRLPGGFFGPADFLVDNARSLRTVVSDDTALGSNLGLLWKSGRNGRWSVGAVYRQGPDFQTAAELLTRVSEHEVEQATAEGSLHVPDVYGVGIAYSRAEGKTKLTLDYDRIRYSQRLDDVLPRDPEVRAGFRIPDSQEIHLGFEHVFLAVGSQLVGTLRLGAWNESAHDLEYSGTVAESRALYPKGKDVLHWSAGLGLVVKEEYQIDAALDLSDRVTTVSFALVRFF